MDDKKGTDYPEEGCSGWYLVQEAECDDIDDSLEKLFDQSQESDISDLLDNGSVSQGNSLALFAHQCNTESERQLQVLKRKFLPSPDKNDLSPRLQTLTISPGSDRVKKRLFIPPNDSGIDIEVITENEVEDTNEELQVDHVNTPRAEEVVSELCKSKNVRILLFAKFKEAFVCSFTEITRPFKSDKTCIADWVVFAYGMSECFYESAKELLSKSCEYLHMKMFQLEKGNACLFLMRYKTQKCRETILKMFVTSLGVTAEQMLIDPPNIRKPAAAIFWYKASLSNTSFVVGETPEWIRRHTMVSLAMEEEKTFDLSLMIQWAYDNDFTDECTIAYEYAKIADEEGNAAAFLKSNNQAKYVKDCTYMVRQYKRAEMKNMNMGQWIRFKLSAIKKEGDWKEIVRFLRYQNLSFINFIIIMKQFLKGIPKKNCVVLYGPPNTGKSLFCMSLLRVLHGKVISFTNRQSQFWLQPLADTKIALLDDATYSCWQYIDVYLRNALDGNPISLDCKHKAPMQIKCPPLLITTNVDVLRDDTLKYIHSRIQVLEMRLEFPLTATGEPGFNLNDENWKSFFERFWEQLELPTEEEDAETSRPFRCGSREPSDIL
nr:TPA_asm: E1 [Manis javanica papillomavirus 1]